MEGSRPVKVLLVRSWEKVGPEEVSSREAGTNLGEADLASEFFIFRKGLKEGGGLVLMLSVLMLGHWRGSCSCMKGLQWWQMEGQVVPFSVWEGHLLG